MTRDVQKLVVDRLRRVPWWAWLLAATCHGGTTLNYLVGAFSGLRNVGAIGAAIMVGSLLNRSWLGVVSGLPLARRDIRRAQWWIGIGVPGAMLTGLDCLVALGVRLGAHHERDLWHVALWLTSNWAALGALIALPQLLSRLGARTPVMVLINAMLFGLVSWGAPTAGPGLAATLIVGVSGLASAFAAYVWRTPLGPFAPAPAAHARVVNTSASNQSGWAVLVAIGLRYTLLFGGLLGAGVLAMRLAWVGSFPDRGVLGLAFMFSAPVSVVQCLILPTYAARTFRSLPLSIDRLAALAALCGFVPAAFLFLCGLAAAGMSLSDLGSLVGPALMVAALATLAVPIKLRMGEIRGALVFSLGMLLGIVMPLGTLLGLTELDLTEAQWQAPLRELLNGGVVLAPLIVAIGLLWTRHELAAGPNAYLPAPPSPLLPAPFSGGSGRLAA